MLPLADITNWLFTLQCQQYLIVCANQFNPGEFNQLNAVSESKSTKNRLTLALIQWLGTMGSTVCIQLVTFCIGYRFYFWTANWLLIYILSIEQWHHRTKAVLVRTVDINYILLVNVIYAFTKSNKKVNVCNNERCVKLTQFILIAYIYTMYIVRVCWLKAIFFICKLLASALNAMNGIEYVYFPCICLDIRGLQF